MNTKKLVFSSSVSASVSIIAIAVVTIWSELAPSFKNFLASITGHHWITKSLIVVILFPAVLALTRRLSCKETSAEAVRKGLWILVTVTIVGFVVILGFFLWEFFK